MPTGGPRRLRISSTLCGSRGLHWSPCALGSASARRRTGAPTRGRTRRTTRRSPPSWSCVVGPRYCYDFSADWEVEVLARICRDAGAPAAFSPMACAEAGRIGSCNITSVPGGVLPALLRAAHRGGCAAQLRRRRRGGVRPALTLGGAAGGAGRRQLDGLRDLQPSEPRVARGQLLWVAHRAGEACLVAWVQQGVGDAQERVAHGGALEGDPGVCG